MLIILFLLLKFIKGHISHEYIELVKKALNSSDEPNTFSETKYPGFYSFPDIKFTLKMIVTAPNTNDIKSYYIENNMISIVKNTNYSLHNNFAFIDPSQQKIYKMIEIIASNDTTIIFSSIEITIFDIMTNFTYRKRNQNKSLQAWIDDETNDITLYKVYDNSTFFRFGVSTYGKSSITTIVTFNSKFDLKIITSIICEISFDYKIYVPINCSFNTTRFVNSFQFDTLKYQQKDEQNSGIFSFLGLIIDIQFIMNTEMSPFNCKIRIPFEYQQYNNKKIVASKQIEITPYDILDSNWIMQIIDMEDKVKTSKEINLNPTFSPQLDLTMKFKFYFNIEFYFGAAFYDYERNSTLKSGFEILFRLGYGYNLKYCLYHYLYGYNEYYAYNFYLFNGFSYKDDFGKYIYIIKPNKTIQQSKSDAMRNYCLGDSLNLKIKEGYSNIFNIDTYSIYFNDYSVYWTQLPKFISAPSSSMPPSSDTDCQFFMEVINKSSSEIIMLESLPSQTFPVGMNNDKKINRQFISDPLKKSNEQFYVNFYYKFWCNQSLYGCKSSTDVHLINNNPTNAYHSILNSGFPTLYANTSFALIKALQLHKLFNNFKSKAIAYIPADGKYFSVLRFEHNYTLQIDNKAQFSTNLSPKGSVILIGNCSAQKDYIKIKITEITIVQQYFYNNIYILCDNEENMICSKRLLPIKVNKIHVII